jgi:hypothetical protein
VSIHHAVENTGALCTTHQKTHMGMIKLNLTKIWFLWSITYEKCYRTVLASSKDLHCWLLTWVSTIYRYFGCTLRRLILLDSCKTMPRRVDWAYPSSFWFFSCRSCSSKSSKQKIVSHLKLPGNRKYQNIRWRVVSLITTGYRIDQPFFGDVAADRYDWSIDGLSIT